MSPPALVAKRIDPPSVAGYNYEMSFERTEDDEEEAAAVEVEDVIEDLEKQKRWMEMQFEEAEDAAQGIFQQIPSRVQPLADIEEGKEDEESLNGSDRLVGRLKESLSSTPEFDVLSGRRYFTRSGDVDDLSVDSLQDFERLELELHAEKLRRQSNGSGSQESLNGRRIGSRSSGGDNISVNSLTEFERLERDMAEAAKLTAVPVEDVYHHAAPWVATVFIVLYPFLGSLIFGFWGNLPITTSFVLPLTSLMLISPPVVFTSFLWRTLFHVYLLIGWVLLIASFLLWHQTWRELLRNWAHDLSIKHYPKTYPLQVR